MIVTAFGKPNPFQTIYETQEGKANRLEAENAQLRVDIALERKLRYDAERNVEECRTRIKELETTSHTKKQKKTDTSKETPLQYTEFKADGKRKPRPAESIRSYEEFAMIQNYFLEKDKIRDWAFWTVGVSLGLRVSDLLGLKICSILNEDFSFKKRISVVEQKTDKTNDCLITESVVDALKKYFNSINWQFGLQDYVFMSRKTKGKMFEEYGWKILSDAGKALSLTANIGSHTMRKSFANIAACVDKSVVDMNAITKIQGLLNHSDQKVTMSYLGTFRDMYDKARVAVSEFVLGRSDIHELVAGNNYSIDDIVSKLDIIEGKLKSF
jgi:integrase